MTKNATLHMRIDQETKQNAEQLFASFGISITDAMKMFLHQSLAVGGLPFEIHQPRYNAETEAAMLETLGIMDGSFKTKSYASVAEMHADIANDRDEDDECLP